MARNFGTVKWQAIGIITVVLFVHLSYINNGLVWLDHGDIEEKRAIIPIPELLTVFLTRFGETGFYRPVVALLVSIEYEFFNVWAPGYHTVNVLLHLGVVVASVFFFKRFFNFPDTLAWISALVVALHPLSWFTVGTIASLPDLLCTLFVLLAITWYIKSREKNTSPQTKKRNLLLFLLFSFISFLSKETALVLVPGLVAVWEITQPTIKNLSIPKQVQSVKFVLIGLAIIYSIYFALRLVAVPEGWKTQTHPLPLSEAIGTRLSATARSIFALLTPVPARISDATEIVGAFNWKALVVIMLFILSSWIIKRNGFHSKASRLILFFLLAIAPGLNIIPLPRFWTTNYGYFATVGVGATGGLLWMWSRRKKSLLGKSIQIGIVFWIVMAGISTARAGYKLSDDRTLFEEEVRKNGNFKEGAYYLGNYYWHKGALDTAAQYFTQSLEEDLAVIAYVDRSSAHVNYAGVLVAQGKTDEAENILQEVITTISGKNARLARYNLAVITQTKGDFTRVVELLDGHIDNWNKEEPWLLLIKAYASLQKKDDAKRVLKEAWPFLDSELQQKLQPLLQSK